MNILTISTIERNEGALTQQYRIDYKLSTDVNWIAGPTFSYDQAQPKPLGLLSYDIILPANWSSVDVNVRAVTICGPAELPGPVTTVHIGYLITEPVDTFYWGWVDDLSFLPATKADILLSTHNAPILHLNDPLVADFSGSGPVAVFWWIAYPNTQTVKNQWLDTFDALDSGMLGGPTDLMHAPTNIDDMILHVTGYKTYQEHPIQFNHV